MEKINEVVSWYQQKIGAYDKQIWEDSVEKTVLKNIRNVPRKIATFKSELIDVDLVRGSTFTKAKPQHSWHIVVCNGLMRIIFLPFFFKWWQQQTSTRLVCLLTVLYILQISSLGMCVYHYKEMISSQKSVLLEDLIYPVILMTVLALIHAQIVATQRHKPLTRKKETTKNDRKSAMKTPKKKKTQSTSKSALNQTTSSSFPKGREPALLNDLDLGLVRSMSESHTQSTDLASVDSKSRIEVSSTKSPPSLLIPNIAFENHSTVHSSNDGDGDSDSDGDGEAEADDDSVTLTSISKTRSESTGSTGSSNFEMLSDERMIYKSLDENDPTTCNTEEHFSGLTDPISDCTGEILLPKEPLLETPNSQHVDVTVKRINASYIPSLSEQCEGKINLIGIKKRQVITQSKEPKKTFSEDVELQEDKCDLPLYDTATAPPDPLNLSDDCPISETMPETTKGERVKKQVEYVHDKEGERVKEQVQYVHDRDKESNYGKIDLVGIMKRNQYGSILKRRKRSVSNHDKSSLRPRSNTDSRKQPPNHLEINEVRDLKRNEGRGASSCESEADDTPSPLHTPKRWFPTCSNLRDGPASEWEDNMVSEIASSDSSSCSSSQDDVTNKEATSNEEDLFYHSHVPHSVMISSSPSDKTTCVIWEAEVCKKIELSTIDIGWSIIDTVDKIPENSDYIIVGLLLSLVMAAMPLVFRFYQTSEDIGYSNWRHLLGILLNATDRHWKHYLIILNGLIQRFCLCSLFFFLLSVAERTFKQRLLYAKHFCYLTSTRRARKYDLPHFRLNKVVNIKTWLSLRSYLKKRGPQRSVNVIVSSTFLIGVVLVSIVCIEFLKNESEAFTHHLYNWELVVWVIALGIYMLRFITLGTKINKKYRNLSVLITEQINLYLRMEQKPHKKEELMLANNVLKLAEELIKELESPFKISGFSANPFLYNITKVVILSAISAVLTELLGFKLKVYKIKLKT